MGYLIVFLVFLTQIFASEIDLEMNEPKLAAESEPLAMVAGCVNAISGSFFLCETDLITPTIAPLTLSRSYDSDGEVHGSIGVGHGFQYPILASTGQKRCKNLYASVGIREGQYLVCRSLKNPIDGKNLHKFRVDSRLLKKGCSSLSGKGNLKNWRGDFRSGGKETPWEIQRGDGTRLIYKSGFYAEGDCLNKLQIPKGTAYLLSEETLPNGNRREFEYDFVNQVPVITSLKTYNRAGKLINSIKGEKWDKGIVYRAPTGEQAIYQIFHDVYRKDHDWISGSHLEYVSTHQFAPSAISNKRKGPKARRKICSITKPGGYQQIINYYDDNRVKSLEHTTGPCHKLVKTHEFGYLFNRTMVRDCYGLMSVYEHDQDQRVTSIARHKSNTVHKGKPGLKLDDHEFLPATLLRKDAFVWGTSKWDEGWLKEKSVWDNKGLYYKKKYEYDKYGNVIKETVIDKSGNRYETYHEYSRDGFNNLARTSRPDGWECRFSYLPGTNLKIQELELLNGHVHRRKFYTYDDNGEISVAIEDDGFGLSEENLSDVTYRRVKKVAAIEEEGPNFGKPKAVENYAWNQDILTLLNRSEYSYDNKGNEISVRVYDSKGCLHSESSKVYDDRHRVIASMNSLGLETTFGYDESNNKVFEFCAESGVTTQYHYNAANRLIGTSTTYPDGEIRTTSHTYDALGRQTSVTDEYGHTTQFEYDLLGNVCKTIHPDTEGTSTTFTKYNALNQIVKETDENGYSTLYERNIFGDVTKTIFPDGSSETRDYTQGGHLKSLFHSDGTRTHFDRDPLGRPLEKSIIDSDGRILQKESYRYKGEHLIETVDLAGLKTIYTYDGAGRLTSRMVGDKITHFEKDDFDRDIKVIEGERVRRITYDPEGNILSETDEDLNGNVYLKKTFAYDKFGNEIEQTVFITKELGSTKQTSYYPDQSVQSITDAAGNTTRFIYNKSHILETRKIDPLGRELRTLHDSKGRVSIEELIDSHLIYRVEKRYDPTDNLLEEVVYSTNGDKTYRIEREYDCMGRVSALTEEGVKTTRFNYDSRGRQFLKTLPDGTQIHTVFDGLDRPVETWASDNSFHTRQAYDAHGNIVVSEDLITGTKVLAEYDLQDRLEKEVFPDGGSVFYKYDYLDRVTQLTLPDGTTMEYYYDPYNLKVLRRVSSNKTTLYEVTFDAYDQRGRLLKLTTPAGSTTYDYDILGRLVERKSRNFRVTLDAYDAVSNLLQETETLNGLATLKTYAYDSQNHLISETGNTFNRFGYDALGNCMVENGQIRAHDRLNRLTNTSEETFIYDDNGRLIERPDLEKSYKFDAYGRLIAYKTPGENYTFTYAAGPRLMQYAVNGDEKSLLYFGDHEIGSLKSGEIRDLKIIDPTDPERVLAIEVAKTPYFVHQDARNNTVLLESSNGFPFETYSYSAFSENSKDGLSKTSPWRFANRRVVGDLSLFQYRLYDAKIRRWITPDPLDFEDGYNLYAYNRNNPLRYYDPDGRFIWALPLLTWGGGAGLTFCITAGEVVGALVTGAASYGIYEGFKYYDKHHGTHVASDYEHMAGGLIAIPVYTESCYSQSVYSQSTLANTSTTKPETSLTPSPQKEPDNEDSSKAKAAATAGAAGGGAALAKNAVKKLPHKNSLSYVGDTHVYTIRGPKGVFKVGESAQGLRKMDSASRRAEQQVRKLYRQTGEKYRTEILQKFDNKKDARNYETSFIETYRRLFGQDTLPGNLTNR